VAYEDFTTYTEVDPGANITKTATKVSWNDLATGSESYICDDKGVDHFSGDFEHLLEITMSDCGFLAYQCWWVLANGLGTPSALATGGGDLYYFYQFGGSSIGITIIENGVNGGSDYWGSPSQSTLYFVTINRDDDSGANSTGRLTVYIRTGSHTGTLKDTLTVDCKAGEQNDFRYVYPCSSYGYGSQTCDGYTQNLDLQEAAPPVGATPLLVGGGMGQTMGSNCNLMTG